MENTLPSVSDVVQQMKEILVLDLLLGVKPEEVADDSSILEDGLALDSIVIEEFIVRIEDRFRVRFDDQVLSRELLSNLSRLGTFVVREMAAAGSTVEAAPVQTSHAGSLLK